MTDLCDNLSNIPDVAELLPHQAPMILVDKLISVDDENVHTQVIIKESEMFFNHETQSVPSYVGIEYMAQTIGAWSGFHAWKKCQKPAVGFLLGTRRYTCEYSEFPLGLQLDIFAEYIMESNGMAAFQCRIKHAGKELATAQLNAFAPSEQQLADIMNSIRN
ncbi:MAG: hotdog family protein [Vibrio sp.]